MPRDLARRDLRRRPALRLRRPADRRRGDLRRLRDGPDHAPARRASPRTSRAGSRTSSRSSCCRSSSSSPACGRRSARSTASSCGSITLGLIVVAVVGKWVGAMAAARYGGFGWRDSAAVGALMNTRGLTELIVLNIGLELGLISPTLFTMLVVMALVTTFMAGPALRLIDPHGRLSAPAEEELQARAARGRAGRLARRRAPLDHRRAAGSRGTWTSLLSVAGAARTLAAAARAHPRPARRAAALRDGARRRRPRAPARRPTSLQRRRETLVGGRPVDARDRVHDPGRGRGPRAARTGRAHRRRPRRRATAAARRRVPKGEVGRVLADAESDVAVLVERERGALEIDAGPACLRAVRRRRARLGGARARRVDRPRPKRPAPPLGASFDVEQGDARREPAARERLARRAAADRDRRRAGARQPGPGRDPEGERRRPARRRPLRPLARGRARRAALGDRQGRARRRCCSSVAGSAAACSRPATT